MAYNIPPGLLALAAQTGGQAPSGFGGSMASVLGTINQGQQAAGQRSDRQMQQMMQIAQMEQKVRAAEEQRALQMQQQQAAQRKSALEQQQAAELRAQLPPEYRELFDVDQKAAIGQAFQDPTSLQQNLQAAGYTPGTPEYQKELMNTLNKAQTVINMPKTEGPIPQGKRAVRDDAGNLLRYEKVEGATVPEADKKAALFATQINTASASLSSLEQGGYNPATPLEVFRGHSRNMQSKEGKAYEDAANAWITGHARLQSGADVKDSELERLKKIFIPVLGDTPEDIQRKAAARRAMDDQLNLNAEGAVAPGSAPAAASPPPDKPVSEMTPAELDQWERELTR